MRGGYSYLALVALLLALACWLLGFLTLAIYRRFRPYKPEDYDGYLIDTTPRRDGFIKTAWIGMVWLALILMIMFVLFEY
jgi:hypothetical protein